VIVFRAGVKSEDRRKSKKGQAMQTRFLTDIKEEDLVDLYTSVGWTTYAKDSASLRKAIENSSFVVSMWDEGKLVGLARCVSDDVSISYIQDILVRPSHQRRGVGRSLVRECLSRYGHVRQTALLTDDLPEQARFYESLGFANTKVAEGGVLNAFVLMRDSRLSL
jgi:ribosomal protein S18 acetylase RimI-like enzyme